MQRCPEVQQALNGWPQVRKRFASTEPSQHLGEGRGQNTAWSTGEVQPGHVYICLGCIDP